MRRLLVRRSLTAVGIYSSVVLGFLATVVATRELGTPRRFGDYATVIFATGFFQSFFDLTVEEALVKYGFRYLTREDWGRLRRLFSSALRFKLAGSILGALGLAVFAAFAPSRRASPPGSRSASRWRVSPARFSISGAATTSAPSSSRGRWRCGSPVSRPARTTG